MSVSPPLPRLFLFRSADECMYISAEYLTVYSTRVYMYDVLHAKGAYYASVHSTRVFSGGRRRLRTSRRFTLMDA